MAGSLEGKRVLVFCMTNTLTGVTLRVGGAEELV